MLSSEFKQVVTSSQVLLEVKNPQSPSNKEVCDLLGAANETTMHIEGI